MITDDGKFEIEFVDDSAPGVFLPTVTIARGIMSRAALVRYEAAREVMSAEQLDRLLRKVIKTRLECERTVKGVIRVRHTDFPK